MVDLSSLADIPTDLKGWQPLTPEALTGPDLTLLCLDPSFTATGLVVLERKSNEVLISRSITLRPPDMRESGFIDDYMKAIWCEDRFADEIQALERAQALSQDFRILHEMPPVLNRRVMAKLGPRAGIPARMVGQAVWSAAHRFGLLGAVEMVNAQQAKKAVCGNAKADKSEAHAELKKLTWIQGIDQVTNEHERDALSAGLTVMKASAR